MNQAHHISAIRRNFRRLNIIRCITVGGQFLALYYFWKIQNIGLPGTILTTILLIYSAVLGVSCWRGHWRAAITELEFFGHLLIDVIFFTALLYFSGGANNPFVSYYLVPISIAAATLPRSYGWIIAALSLAAYSGLFAYNYPVIALAPFHNHHGSDDSLNLHTIGMWGNFLVSAVLISFFVTRMASELRQQQNQANLLREQELRNDQVLAVATLAAGTTHELSTPLNTMRILLDEISDTDLPAETRQDITTLQQQVNICRKTLQQLAATAELASDKAITPQNLRGYFVDLLENWQLIRPDAAPSIHIDSRSPEVEISYPPTVAQSLLNLFNNAADASRKIDIYIRWDQGQATVNIRDYGPGIKGEQAEKLGTPFVSSKAGGLGLGLFLSRSTLERLGGEVIIRNHPEGGAETRIILPTGHAS
ncbi:ATP-binding protein [Porticoccaceae bacterium LTM1]|nr:ATP-binding protein [Porticoccaceae bacterium LTM1]